MERATDPGSTETTHTPAEPSRGRGLIKWTMLLAALAVAGAIGLRIKQSLEAKAEFAAATQAQAARASKGTVSRPVEVTAPVADRWTPNFRVEGTLSPLRAVDLAFKTGGRLGAIKVARGDRVNAGALLATLEASEARAQQEAAEAQVKAAEAQLALARDAEDRMTKLKGAMSEQSVVQARANVALAAAQLEGARAQAKLAAVNVENHTLTAPFRGLVVRAPTAPGAIVAPGVPMFRVEDTTTLQLDASLGAEEAALVSPGSPVEVETAGRTLEAKLTLVLDTLDQLTRRVTVAAELTNDAKDPVRPGAFVRARIRGQRPIDVLRLPASALRPGSQDVVMVIEGDKLRERRVVFALSPEGELLVRRGLTLEDRVVRAPAAEAADGDPYIRPLETK